MGCAPCQENKNTNKQQLMINYLTDETSQKYKQNGAPSLIKSDVKSKENFLKIEGSTPKPQLQLLKTKKSSELVFNASQFSFIGSNAALFSVNTGSSNQMLKLFNLARSNPTFIIPKIEDLKNSIKTDLNETFLVKNKIKIKLKRGVEAFDHCIEYLKQNNKMNTLIFNEKLKIPVLIDSSNDFLSRDFMEKSLKYKTLELKGELNILDFHYDVCVNDPELSGLLQIVDDTNSNYQRRKNIFNQNAKFVGITDININASLVCYYLLFAK